MTRTFFQTNAESNAPRSFGYFPVLLMVLLWALAVTREYHELTFDIAPISVVVGDTICVRCAVRAYRWTLLGGRTEDTSPDIRYTIRDRVLTVYSTRTRSTEHYPTGPGAVLIDNASKLVVTGGGTLHITARYRTHSAADSVRVSCVEFLLTPDARRATPTSDSIAVLLPPYPDSTYSAQAAGPELYAVCTGRSTKLLKFHTRDSMPQGWIGLDRATVRPPAPVTAAMALSSPVLALTAR